MSKATIPSVTEQRAEVVETLADGFWRLEGKRIRVNTGTRDRVIDSEGHGLTPAILIYTDDGRGIEAVCVVATNEEVADEERLPLWHLYAEAGCELYVFVQQRLLNRARRMCHHR